MSRIFVDPELGPMLPYDAVIMIEPPLLNRDVITSQKKFIARIVALNKAIPDVWHTMDDAINWHKERAPWKTWDPEVLQVFLVKVHLNGVWVIIPDSFP